MGEQLLIGIMIGICLLALLAVVTKSKLLSVLTRMGMSGIMIIVMNCLLPQYMIGFNIYTLGFSSLLGLPGLMTLYLLKMIV